MAIQKVKMCDFCERIIEDNLDAKVIYTGARKDVCKRCLTKITKKPEQPKNVKPIPMEDM